jgi:hypothetical protein
MKRNDGLPIRRGINMLAKSVEENSKKVRAIASIQIDHLYQKSLRLKAEGDPSCALTREEVAILRDLSQILGPSMKKEEEAESSAESDQDFKSRMQQPGT